MQLTLRDADEARVWAWLETILQRFPDASAERPGRRHHAAVPHTRPDEAQHDGHGWVLCTQAPERHLVSRETPLTALRG